MSDSFRLSEEQELLQETVSQFAANECPPTRVRAIFDGPDGHDTELWKGLVELGPHPADGTAGVVPAARLPLDEEDSEINSGAQR